VAGCNQTAAGLGEEDAKQLFSLMMVAGMNVLLHGGCAVQKWVSWLGHNRDALWE